MRFYKRHIKYICLFLLAIISIFPQTEAVAVNIYGDIIISEKSSPPGMSFHGYVEYEFTITNKSLQKAREVTIQGPAVDNNYGDSIRKISRTVKIGPSSTINLSFMQPPLNMNGYDMEVTIDKRLQAEKITFSPTKHCYYRAFKSPEDVPLCILLSRSVNPDYFKDNAARLLTSSSSRYYYSKSYKFVESNFKTEFWSSNWLSYTRYDGIVLTVADLESMNSGVRSAIFNYAGCGGSILILGNWKAPKNLSYRYNTYRHLKIFYTGFGVCVSSSMVNPAKWDDKVWHKLKAIAWKPSTSTVLHQTNITEANKLFPVVENLSIPIKGLFFLIIVFAIVIGPLNLIVLRRLKKRIWLIWTIPLISVIASFSVFIYSIISEGWTGFTRTNTLTILDENTHRAYTIGLLAYYWPLTPQGGLHFDYNTEVSCHGLETKYTGRNIPGGRGRHVDLTNDQHLSSGWIVARVPAHFFIRKNQTRRERVSISKDTNGDLVMQNGLGADIDQFWYSDTSNKIFLADNIASGQKIILKPAGKNLPGYISPDIWRKTFAGVWAESGKQIIASPENYLKPGCYIAKLSDSIFVEQALGNLKKTDSQSIVYGILKGKHDAD